MAGRVLAIGDVHGCHCAFATLIGMLTISSSDTVVFLGDLVDRGPATKEVVTEVLMLSSRCKMIHITGNHEEMMRNAIGGKGLFSAWLDSGGQATLDSYGGNLENIPSDHIRFLVSSVPFHQTETDIFVHASLESNVSLANQTSDFLRWKHLGGQEPPHISGKRVICGHTVQTDGVPLVFDGWVCIDTYPHGGKWLTCLDVENDYVFQASQTGDKASGRLKPTCRVGVSA